MATDGKSIVLGSEHDLVLRAALLRVLHGIGASPLDRSSGVAGSQLLETFRVAVGEQSLLVEAETYIGLSISGAADLVDHVAKLVKQAS